MALKDSIWAAMRIAFNELEDLKRQLAAATRLNLTTTKTTLEILIDVMSRWYQATHECWMLLQMTGDSPATLLHVQQIITDERAVFQSTVNKSFKL